MPESNRIEYKQELTDNFLRMVFPASEDVFQNVDEGGAMGGAIGGQDGGQDGGQVENLTERQREILEIIRNDNKISYRTLAEMLDINESAMLKHIEALKKKGALERVGGTQGHWLVKTK